MSRPYRAAKAQTMVLRPYPDYKPADLPWLDRIPAHWEVLPFKRVFRERSEKGYPQEPMLACTQTKGVVRKDQYESRTVVAQKDFHLLKLVRRGDFVISLRAFEGGIEFAHEQGIISPAYTVLTPRSQVEPAFMRGLLKSTRFIQSLTLVITGIREGQNIDYGRLSKQSLPLPPKEEQEAIAAFVAAFDARINRLVGAKQRLLKLLAEQRQGIVQRAVTRGLDPDVPTKPSGVPWLGDIPAHWEVRRVKSLSRVKRGASPRPIDDPRYFDPEGEYAWVRIQDVTASSGRLVNSRQRLSEIGSSRSVRLGPGSLLLSIAGSVGKSIISDIKCCIHDGFVCFPDLGSERDFLHTVFGAGSVFSGLGKEGTQLNLNTDIVGGMSIALPPLNEQRTIVAHLDRELAGIDAVVAKVRREIDLVREYRTRLVSDVVTGRLDVRGAELPPLPGGPAIDAYDTEPEDAAFEDADALDEA